MDIETLKELWCNALEEVMYIMQPYAWMVNEQTDIETRKLYLKIHHTVCVKTGLDRYTDLWLDMIN